MRPLLSYLMVMAVSSTSWACMHFNKDYKYEIKEGVKTAFLFHEGKSAHLIVKTELETINGPLPSELAWVMPFPSLPTKYEEVDAKIFDELETAVRVPSKHDKFSKGLRGMEAGSGQNGIKVHEAKQVGNYKIQPIEILDSASGKEFNEWLSKNQFNPMPLELQKIYLKKGAVFLATRMKLEGTAANLKPIHIVYPADNLSFPLKFTHETRTYGIDLFLLTSGPIPLKRIDNKYLTFDGARSWQPRNSDEHPLLGKLLKGRAGNLVKITGRDLNGPGKKLADLAADPTFEK